MLDTGGRIMSPINQLLEEHRVIGDYLEIIALARGVMENGGRLPMEFFEGVVEFAREFVDRYHHYKEEHQLFVLLAQKKGGQLDAHIGTLRQQHEHNRNRIAALARSIEAYDAGDPIHETWLLEHLAGFSATLCQHIHSENRVFFPLASLVVRPGEEAALMEVFRTIDAEMGADYLENTRALLDFMRGLVEAAAESVEREEKRNAPIHA
jgi:hemerythrin-like domain-containing protein